MESFNPEFASSHLAASEAAPDGDVQLTDDQVRDFATPACSRCGDGVLKPDIVFFGDNVPATTKDFCVNKLMESDCLLVRGRVRERRERERERQRERDKERARETKREREREETKP